ncbi:uncharacterized protein MONBRDRAFT_19734 [Monosiga brevicollis MX1]|uniref:ABC transporter domain-containing protein n=1 Tax=Monosiga brevicollis TaxID=81824 RepID=A9UR74_MONBE|nr:uncharacterized protein MONBRDRAFT_19734 [Monosiga brevicollis MX1]EDQ91872.1 predicted protein [Monosiga brevicollis MX1]|eukprot:XP_001743158.1 hypothetical protein [Monosiga brevicollis MX1]
MLSVMGASGAGKTTLLNMLAGRLSDAGHGRSSGSITINGYKRDFDTFRHISAYVLQSDSFFPELTVRETIMLSAKLRLPHDMPMSEKKARVDAIIAELGLRKVENSYVGNELIRGVSGGERKRVNVGTELVTNPSLIFLDEPTSGLDSFNAQNVMQTLMQLAGNGRTVVATIHQPRSTITNMFDKLLLLSEGQTIYFGEAHTAVDYFAQVGYPCPSSFNPADFYLDLISLDQRSAESQRITTKRIEYLVGRYVDHAAKHDTLALPAPAEKNNAPPTSTVAKHGKYANSWFTQFKLLSQRSIRLMMREKENNIAMIAQTLLFAVLLGLIWLREGDNLNEEGGVTAIAGALFFILVNQSFGGIFGIIFLFPSERIIVLKERASRSYHVGAYFWSKTLAELPRTFVTSLVFSVIGYFMVGLRDDGDNFFRFVLILFMVTLASEGLAYIVSAIAKDPQQAGAIAPAFVVTSMLFGGFFIGSDAIPVFLFWLKYLSFLNYGFAAAMQNEFSDRVLANCTGAPEDDVCFTQGSEVLDFYKVDELSFAANLWILLALIVGFRLIAYLILLRNGPVYDLAL